MQLGNHPLEALLDPGRLTLRLSVPAQGDHLIQGEPSVRLLPIAPGAIEVPRAPTSFGWVRAEDTTRLAGPVGHHARGSRRCGLLWIANPP